MGTQHFGVFEEDRDPTPEVILERYNPYIVALVEQLARRSPNLIRPEALDLEIDEIAQCARYRLWKALLAQPIAHPKAYISRIVQNVFHDLSRKRKPPLPLITDDDGELYIGDAEVMESGEMANPAERFEEDESLEELLDSTASAVATLSPRQQQAMICELNEKIDTTVQLLTALRKHEIFVESLDWPEDETDKKLLKASLSPARRKVAVHLRADMDLGQ